MEVTNADGCRYVQQCGFVDLLNVKYFPRYFVGLL